MKLEPSLAAGMLGSLDYLEHYPYECTEQTVSRFLPNVVTFQALQKLGISRPELATPLAQQVGVGLQRLYAGQHVDGGWGWWAKDASDPTVSSYVVLGMAKAKQAGFTVDPTALDRGIRYLKSQLRAPTGLKPWELNQQALMLYALAEAGAAEPNRAGALYERREALSLYGKATLALAFGLIDDAASKTRIQTLLADITSKAITSGTSTHWEEAWLDSRNMNTDTRTTAIIIDALARLDPKHSLAPNAVRWLMGARQADHWETTQESAWAIMALTDWMAATGELEGDYTWKVLLNDGLLGQGQVKPATVGQVTTLQADIAVLLADQTNALLIQRGQAADQIGEGAALLHDPPQDLRAGGAGRAAESRRDRQPGVSVGRLRPPVRRRATAAEAGREDDASGRVPADHGGEGRGRDRRAAEHRRAAAALLPDRGRPAARRHGGHRYQPAHHIEHGPGAGGAAGGAGSEGDSLRRRIGAGTTGGRRPTSICAMRRPRSSPPGWSRAATSSAIRSGPACPASSSPCRPPRIRCITRRCGDAGAGSTFTVAP